MRAAKQFLSFAGGDAAPARRRRRAGARRRLLRGTEPRRSGPSATTYARASRPPGCDRCRPAGTYFVNAQTLDGDGIEFCRELPERAGVVAIPTAVFYDDPDAGRSLVRFAFCKRTEVIDEAAARLAAAPATR